MTMNERLGIDPDNISYGELATLTHATQVELFNFCSCEEGEEFPYADCPKKLSVRFNELHIAIQELEVLHNSEGLNLDIGYELLYGLIEDAREYYEAEGE